MIILDKLTVEGGLCYNSATFPLAKQGMTLVRGQNLDGGGANGAGKSSFLSILEHIIFATTAKGLRKNAIVSDLAAEGYYGILNANINGVEIEAHQARNTKYGNTNWLLKDKVDLKIKGANESQAAITDAFGLSLEDWYATVHFPQQYRHLFIRSTENDAKKAMLARIFALNYSCYKTEMDQKLTETKQELIKLKSSLTSSKATLEAQIEQLELKSIEEYNPIIENLKSQIVGLTNQINSAEISLTNYNNCKIAKATRDSHIEFLTNQLVQAGLWAGSLPTLQAMQESKQTTVGQLSQLSKQITELTNYVTFLQKRDEAYNLYKPYENTELEIDKIENFTSELELNKNWLAFQKQNYIDGAIFDKRLSLEQELQTIDLGMSLTALEKAVEDLKKEKSAVEIELRDTDREVARLKGQLEILKKGSCPTCGQDIPDSITIGTESALENLEKIREEIQANLQSIEGHLTKYSESLITYHRTKNLLDLTNSKISENERNFTQASWLNKVAEVQKRIVEIETWFAGYNKHKAVVDNWATYKDIKENTSTYLDALKTVKTQEDEFKSYCIKLDQIIPSLQTFENLPEVILVEVDELALGGQIRHWREQKTQFESQLTLRLSDKNRLISFLAHLEQIKGRESEIKTLEDNEQIYQSLSYAFGPKGLIISRLEIICKYMTEKVNFFLSKIMKDNVNLRFYMDGDTLDLEVVMNKRTRGIGNLSGGEGLKVGLACMLGLRSLIPDRYQTNILALDETDQNWDGRTRLEYFEILQNLLETTKLDSIFVISHAQELLELQSWDTLWTCTKSNGISTLAIDQRI